MSADPIRVAIVGCGQIGSRWDMPGTVAAGGPSLTHAAAFSRQPGARIVGFCDADLARAREAVLHWGCGRPFGDVAAMLDAVAPDVAVVATPSAVRRAVIDTVLAAGVRTLVIEKPLAPTPAEGEAIVGALRTHGAHALVNYLRHWDAALHDLRVRIAAGQLGSVQRLVGWYGKGLANSGSHLIDLAGLLLDSRPVAVRALGTPLPPAESAWSEGSDRVVDAQVRFADSTGSECQLDMLATDMRAFTCFELELIGTRAICEIRLGGRCIEWQDIVDDPNFAGYRVPGPRIALPAANLAAMDRMAEDAVRLARGAAPVARCDPVHALAVALAVAAIRRADEDRNPHWQALDA